MKFYRLLAVICLLLTTAIPFATKSNAAQDLKCPECGMPMPTHKTSMMTAPIIVNGTKYYCCAGCPAGKKADAYFKAHHGKVLSIKVPA